MRFDAYAGNVRGGTPSCVVAEAVANFTHARVERGRPRGRYHDCFDVKDLGELVGWVGHDAALDTAYFECKGIHTPEAVKAIRSHWAHEHTASRADACEDFDEPGAYDYLRDLVDRTKDPRVKSMAITPRDGDRGETIYWGSPSSAAMIRLYEAGKMKDRLHFNRPDWKRLELQCRPAKAAGKVALASMSPLDVWGMSRWTQRVAEQVAQSPVARFVAQQDPSTFDRTTLYLARAFRRHLDEMLADFGSWSCIGSEIQQIWKLDDEAHAKLAQRPWSKD